MSFFKKIGETFKGLSPSNYTVVDKKEYNVVKGNLNAILRGWDRGEDMVQVNDRPSLPLPYVDTPSGSKLPLWRLQPQRMYDLAQDVGDLRAILETIKREMFRNGMKVQPRFRYKCLECLKTFKEKPLGEYVPLGKLGRTQKKEEKLVCDECDNDDPKKFKKPDPEGRVTLQTFLEDTANNNEQTLKKIGMQYETDLDVVDYAFCAVSRDYKVVRLKRPDPITGATHDVDIPNSEIKEFVRVHPMQVSMIANDEGRLGLGSDNRPRWICPNYEHREKFLEEPVCPKCGLKAFTAMAETNSMPFGLPVANPSKQFYAKHELIWTPGRSMPDLLYGNSVLNAVWKKVMSLYHQDEYLWKYFDKDRPPKSLLAIGSRNYETVQSFFERQRQGARADPYMPRPILLNTDNVSSALEYVDLTPNFKELELSNVRTELRQIISSMYGVQPVFYGEQTKSGLGNESLQVTITNRTIKYYQKFLNEDFFRKVSEMMGVYDWEIVLIDSEEIDKLREEQIRNQEIINATQMYQMGFDVWTNGNGEFVFSQFPNPERQAMMNGTGSNIRQGNLDKTEDGKAPQEEKTDFGGQPLKMRPSDAGGAGGSSPSSGSSFSNKAFTDEQIRESVRDVVKKGSRNGWTFSHMAKELDKDTNIGYEKALYIIKEVVENSV